MNKMECPYIRNCSILRNAYRNNYENGIDLESEQCSTLLHKDCSTYKKLNSKDPYEIYKGVKGIVEKINK